MKKNSDNDKSGEIKSITFHFLQELNAPPFYQWTIKAF